MDKLMEIKKLYEAGVLTKEEMEAEKAKILRPDTASQGSDIKKGEDVGQENSTQKTQSKKSEMWPLWILVGIAAFMIVVFVVTFSSRSNGPQRLFEGEYVGDSVAVDDAETDTACAAWDVDTVCADSAADW